MKVQPLVLMRRLNLSLHRPIPLLYSLETKSIDACFDFETSPRVTNHIEPSPYRRKKYSSISNYVVYLEVTTRPTNRSREFTRYMSDALIADIEIQHMWSEFSTNRMGGVVDPLHD